MFEITATDLQRLLACNGSRLMDKFHSEQTDTSVRDEGNAAHWLIEQVFRGNHTVDELVDRPAENGVFITAKMVEHTSSFRKSIGTSGEIENSMSIIDPNGAKWKINCRPDHDVYADDWIITSDFKYGWSIVDVVDNWTMIAYAAAKYYDLAAKGYDLSNFKGVKLVIHQPRPSHPQGRIRTWELSASEFFAKVTEMFSKLDNLDDVLHTGKQCRNCPSLATCPAARSAQMNAIDVSERAYNTSPDNIDLSYLLKTIDRAKKVLDEAVKAYEELATSRIRKGETVEGYAVTSDLANTSWQPHVTAELVSVLTGIDVMAKPSMISPSQAKALGMDDDTYKSLTERKQKGYKLEKVDANALANKLFNNQKG